MIKKLSELQKLSCEEAKKMVDYYANKMIEGDELSKNNVKLQFINLLNQPENYHHFSFGEIVLFFLFEADEFTPDEKELLLKYVCQHIEQVCNSKNEMVPTILLDFIVRHIPKEMRATYCLEKSKEITTRSIQRCLEIIINGYERQE